MTALSPPRQLITAEDGEPVMLKNYAFYVLAAFAEIAGCYSFWAWLRLHKSAWVVLPGLLSLAAFAYFLTRINSDFAGRTYAAYGSIYIAASLAWLWLVENKVPSKWDSVGVGICLVGGSIILLGPR
jgi:small multidrug resistance family-3 protein